MNVVRVLVLVACATLSQGCVALLCAGSCMDFGSSSRAAECPNKERAAIMAARNGAFTAAQTSLAFLANHCDRSRLERAKAVYDAELQRATVQMKRPQLCPRAAGLLTLSWRHPGFAAQAARVRQVCAPQNVDDGIAEQAAALETACQQRATRVRTLEPREPAVTRDAACAQFRQVCSPEEAQKLCGGGGT